MCIVLRSYSSSTLEYAHYWSSYAYLCICIVIRPIARMHSTSSVYVILCKSIPIINNMFKHFQSAIPLSRAKPKESIARRGGCCGLAYFLACSADSIPNPCN